MSLLVVAAAVLREAPGGEVLLTKRLDEGHLANRWEFPGGKVEDGEAPEAAGVRECFEECGIAIRVEDILDVAWHPYPHREILLLFYDCRSLNGTRPEVQHLEVADHAWVAVDQLAAFDLPPPDARLIAKLQAGR
ncbi:MAG: (deoxy)nucleoside triphosphate pyrophosphohydrolase [Sandaracinaceae bacterium]